MPKFTLSKPQKMLLNLAILLFAVGVVWMLYFVVRGITRELSRGIHISYASVSPRDANGPQTQSLTYEEVITQPSGESILTWNNHKLYVLGPAELVITPDTVKLNSGYAYLESNGTVGIAIGSQELSVVNVNGLYDTSIPGFVLTEGTLNVNPTETALPNNTILYDGQKFTTAVFDRANLQTDRWNRVLKLLAEKSQLPVTLSDLVAPTITSLQPSDNAQTTDASVNITGKTEAGVNLLINAKKVTVDGNGNFSQTLELVTGNNTITIATTDIAGNQSITTTHIQRNAPAASAPVVGCAQGDFANQMLCLINNYRRLNSLNTLSLNAGLNSAAQTHSIWMSQHNTLDHTEDNGSTPFTRCNTAGAVCDAENIAQDSNPSAQGIFELWKNSAAHNANMLGNHTEMGAALSGQYATLVLH